MMIARSLVFHLVGMIVVKYLVLSVDTMMAKLLVLR